MFANEVFLGFLIPIDMRLHRVYHLFTTLIHLGASFESSLVPAGGNVNHFPLETKRCAGGHAGYEMSPFTPHISNFIMCLFYGLSHGYRGFNTVKHHDMHHQYPLKHFSLYFTHWDRVCGTLHPRYDSSVVHYFRGVREQTS